MAEILGIAGSIIAVIQLTGQIISLGYDYIGGVTKASKDLHNLVSELQSLGIVLLAMKEFADANPELKTLELPNRKDGPLPGCRQELQKLQHKITPRKGLRGRLDALKWPLEEKETLRHMTQIERQKSLFSLALTTDHM